MYSINKHQQCNKNSYFSSGEGLLVPVLLENSSSIAAISPQGPLWLGTLPLRYSVLVNSFGLERANCVLCAHCVFLLNRHMSILIFVFIPSQILKLLSWQKKLELEIRN